MDIYDEECIESDPSIPPEFFCRRSDSCRFPAHDLLNCWRLPHSRSALRRPRSRRRFSRIQWVCPGFHRSGARRDKTRRSWWCWYEQQQSEPIKQPLSGNCGACFDRNRVPSSPIAVAQQAELFTIDTACHGMRGVAGAFFCFADTADLVSFHISVGETEEIRHGCASREGRGPSTAPLARRLDGQEGVGVRAKALVSSAE